MFCLGKWSANGGFHIELLGYQRAYHFSEPLWSCPRLTFLISQKGVEDLRSPSPSYPHGSASMPGANWVNVTKKPGDNRKTTQVAGLKPHFLYWNCQFVGIAFQFLTSQKWSDDLLFFVKMELLAIFCISNHPNFFGVRILSHTQQQKRKRRWKSRSASRTYTVTCLSCLGPLRRVRATQNCVDAVHLRAGAIPFVDLHEQGIEKQFLWLNHLWPTRSIRSPSVGQLADRCTPWWF